MLFVQVLIEGEERMHLLGPAGYKVPDANTRQQRLNVLMAAALFIVSKVTPAQEILDAISGFSGTSFAQFREDFLRWISTASSDLINLAAEHLIKVRAALLTDMQSRCFHAVLFNC